MSTEFIIIDRMLEECRSDEEIIQVPSTFSEIKKCAFATCKNAKKILLPNRFEVIPVGAFCNLFRLEEIHIGSAVRVIEHDAFCGCISLRHILLEEGITKIETNAFADCWALEDIFLPASLQEIETGALTFASEKTAIHLPRFSFAEKYCKNNGIPYDYLPVEKFVPKEKTVVPTAESTEEEFLISERGELIKYDGHAETVHVPASVKTIGDYAFSGNKEVKEIVLGDGETAIGQKAFQYCIHLQTINLPATITEIGDFAFYCCEALQKITIPEGVKELPRGVFFHCNGLKDIYLPQSIVRMEEPFYRYGDARFHVQEGSFADAYVKTHILPFEYDATGDTMPTEPLFDAEDEPMRIRFDNAATESPISIPDFGGTVPLQPISAEDIGRIGSSDEETEARRNVLPVSPTLDISFTTPETEERLEISLPVPIIEEPNGNVENASVVEQNVVTPAEEDEHSMPIAPIDSLPTEEPNGNVENAPITAQTESIEIPSESVCSFETEGRAEKTTNITLESGVVLPIWEGYYGVREGKGENEQWCYIVPESYPSDANHIDAIPYSFAVSAKPVASMAFDANWTDRMISLFIEQGYLEKQTIQNNITEDVVTRRCICSRTCAFLYQSFTDEEENKYLKVKGFLFAAGKMYQFHAYANAQDSTISDEDKEKFERLVYRWMSEVRAEGDEPFVAEVDDDAVSNGVKDRREEFLIASSKILPAEYIREEEYKKNYILLTKMFCFANGLAIDEKIVQALRMVLPEENFQAETLQREMAVESYQDDARDFTEDLSPQAMFLRYFIRIDKITKQSYTESITMAHYQNLLNYLALLCRVEGIAFSDNKFCRDFIFTVENFIEKTWCSIHTA